MGQVSDQMEVKLREAFAPTQLRINDDSHNHAGHAGAPDGGESHFSVEIISDKFEGLSRIACHRLVNEALADELAGPVHALAITARAPANR